MSRAFVCLLPLALLAGCATATDAEDSLAPVVTAPGVSAEALGPTNPGPTNPCLFVPPSPYTPPPGAGDLDTSFGCLGQATYAVSNVEVMVRALAVQTGDKVIAAGETYNLATNNHNVWVTRYTADGKLDPTFATNGVFSQDFSYPLGGAESAEAVVVQPNGSIVLGGGYWREDNTARKAFLIRLLPDGALDPSFCTGGIVLTTAMTYVRALQVQDSGAIAAAGERCTGKEATCVATVGRYSGTDGTADPSFGVEGVLTTKLGGMSSAHAYGAAVAGNDVVIGGSTQGGVPGSDLGLARYSTGLDTTFGASGIVHLDGAPEEAVRAIATVGNGSSGFLLAETVAPTATTEQFILSRINALGSPVWNFGFLGRAVDGFAGHGASAYALTLSPTGQVVAVGSARDALGRNRIAVTRMSGTGQIDNAFSDDGNVMLTAGGEEAVGTAVVLASTGRIVVGGWSRTASGSKRAVLVRLRDN
jgi:uncharacterized delta-60 repeat protein